MHAGVNRNALSVPESSATSPQDKMPASELQFNKANTFEFVNTLQTYPVLWKVNDEAYRDRNKKTLFLPLVSP